MREQGLEALGRHDRRVQEILGKEDEAIDAVPWMVDSYGLDTR